MGCSPSRSQPAMSLSDKDKADLRKIGYKVNDLKKLFTIFTEIDISSSKRISTYDIQTHCRIEDKVFLSSVFNTVARKDPSSLNFCEFCFCLLYFLTMDTHQLIVFLFRLYAKDKTQTVSLEDLQNIVALTEGAAVAKKTVHEVFIKLDFGNVSELHQSNFEIMFHHSAHFLRPLIQLQLKLRENIVGTSFWLSKKKLDVESPILKDFFQKPSVRPERSRSFAVASVRARSLSIAEAGVLESAASQASSRKAPIASRKMSMMPQRPGDDKLSTSMPSRRASRVIDADGSYRRKSISSMKEESPAAPLDLTFTDDYNTSETSALQEVYQYRKANSTPSPTKTTKSAISNKRRRSLVAAGAC